MLTAEITGTAPRTFKVEIEIRKGKASEWLKVIYPVRFDPPAALGPTQTLAAISLCRVETQLYQSPNFKTDGKNWVIKRVFEGD